MRPLARPLVVKPSLIRNAIQQRLNAPDAQRPTQHALGKTHGADNSLPHVAPLKPAPAAHAHQILVSHQAPNRVKSCQRPVRAHSSSASM